MTTITCPHCHRQITDDSASAEPGKCPHCGSALPTDFAPLEAVEEPPPALAQQKINPIIFVAIGAPAALLVLFGMCCGGCMLVVGLSGSGDETSGQGEVSSSDGYSESSPVVNSSRLYTKAEFIEKIQAIMTNGAYIPERNICSIFCSHQEFIETFGEPDSDSEGVEYKRYWRYTCSDGSLLLTVQLLGGTLRIAGIDKY